VNGEQGNLLNSLLFLYLENIFWRLMCMKRRIWTEEENEKLKEVYPIWSQDELEKYFQRSYSAICRQASSLGIKRQKRIVWTDEEVKFLKENFDKYSVKELANILNKNIYNIRDKIKELSLKSEFNERKWTEKRLKEYINQYEYKYIGRFKGKHNELRVIVECNKGHQYDVDFNAFKRGSRCAKCNGGIRLDYDYVKSEIEKHGYKLHSKEYKNAHEHLDIECPNGHRYKQTWNDFNSGKRCAICSQKRVADSQRLSYETVVKRFEERGYKLLTKEYINTQQILEYICPHHPNEIQTIRMVSLIKGHGCKSCQAEKLRNDRKTDFEIVKADFENKGLILISNEDEYLNCFSDLKFICKKHKEIGIQMDSYHHLKTYSTSICKKCSHEMISGENSILWKGGITKLHHWLRGKINKWKNDSIIACNGKCVITGEDYDDVHHLYSFDLILDEVLKETGVSVKSEIKDYTQEELDILEEKNN
jgi:hypothetical protein